METFDSILPAIPIDEHTINKRSLRNRRVICNCHNSITVAGYEHPASRLSRLRHGRSFEYSSGSRAKCPRVQWAT